MNPRSNKNTPQVEISISARNLVNRDTFSKSDPICVLFTKIMAHEKFYEYGRTEVIYDNLNPNFVTKFTIDYKFEESQHLRFELYDIDNDPKQLGEQDFLGRMDCTLGGILASPGAKLEKPLTGMGGEAGRLTVRAEELGSSKEKLTLQFRCKNVDKKDVIGKSDPFLVISRSNNDGTYTVVHKTEVVKNTLNATWEPFSIRSTALCNGQEEREIKIECFDWDMDGSHDFIGDCTSSLQQLRKRPGIENNYPLMNAKKAKKRGYKNSGSLILMKFSSERDHSFLDYIQGGLEMNFTVAIDFTVSNGNPNELSSLHNRNPAEPNLYARALKAVGEIIQDYDTDKMFPALGFGAKVPPDLKVSHEFFLNLHPSNPFCHGVEGILEAYYRALDRVELYGPTNFSPVIKHVGKFAQKFQDGSHYFVLLILTDGVITDMDLTRAAVIAASSLPISVIIVGIGDADFASMDILDSDEKKLTSNDGSRTAERDIVQFVPFREFIDKHGNLNVSQVFLAKEVLAEIPDQVLSFMNKKKIKPNLRKPATRKSLAPKPAPGSEEKPYKPLDTRQSDYNDDRSSKRQSDRYDDHDRSSHHSNDSRDKDYDKRRSGHDRKDDSRQKDRYDDHGGRSSGSRQDRYDDERRDRDKDRDRYRDRDDRYREDDRSQNGSSMSLRELEKIDTMPTPKKDDKSDDEDDRKRRQTQRDERDPDELDDEEDDRYDRHRKSSSKRDYDRDNDRSHKSDSRRHKDDDRHRSDRKSRGYDDEGSDDDQRRHRDGKSSRESKSSRDKGRDQDRRHGHDTKHRDGDSRRKDHESSRHSSSRDHESDRQRRDHRSSRSKTHD